MSHTSDWAIETRERDTTPCPDCDGRGEFTYPTGPAWYAGQTDDCPVCDGTGRITGDKE